MRSGEPDTESVCTSELPSVSSRYSNERLCFRQSSKSAPAIAVRPRPFETFDPKITTRRSTSLYGGCWARKFWKTPNNVFFPPELKTREKTANNSTTAVFLELGQ